MIAAATTFTPLERRECEAFLSVMPDPIGIGQTLLVNAWTSPQPPLGAEVGFPEMGSAGLPRENNTFLFTAPNGDTDLIGPITSSGEGAVWFNYVPGQTGTWTIKFSWPGDQWYFGCETTRTFVVQQDPVQIWLPGVDLPTDYWDRPISAENREWAQISGPWYLGGFLQMFNGSNNPYNAYTTAPKSAHILWTKELGQSGLIGGPSGSLSRTSASCSPPIVFMGKLYYNARGGFVCVDLSTGEELWWAPGSLTFLEVRGTTGYLWQIAGTEYRRYSPETGALQTTITGGPTGVQQDLDPQHNIIWVFNMPPGYGTRVEEGWLVKWDLTQVRGTNWTTGVVWNTTIPEGGGWSLRRWGDVITQFKQGNRQVGINTTTGALLWAHWRDTPYGAEMCGNGKYYCFYAEEMRWKAFDLDTGDLVWASDQAEYPWGAFAPYIPAVDEDKFYWLSYDGHVYGVDDETGHIEWEFYSGDTTETPYGTWAFWGGPIVGGGVVFAATGEHSPTQPVTRGNRLFAIDTNTGTGLWSIAGLFTPLALAEGYLLAANGYDGYLYVFNKGQTATTVSASPSVVSKGSSVLIEGTVLDQSPAQPGTPCVSKESMNAWMDYLHMQKPCPVYTGVPVKLRAMRSDGSLIEIGTATSDVSGHFEHEWTPPDEDVYKITATFEGDESYWLSWGETGLSVGPTPPEAPTKEDVAEEVVGQLPDYSTMDLAIIVGVVVAIVIGIVNLWALRRRK